QVQRDLEKPENRDNAALRAQLAELQRKLDEAYAAPATPAPNTEGRNAANDPKLNQLTVRLQGLLAKPEVQQNAELKAALEAFLKELSPDQQGPIKPLPPQEPAAPAAPQEPGANF